MLTKDAIADLYKKVILTVIAVFLGVIVLRPLLLPTDSVQAQDDRPILYVEPGTTTIRTPDGSSQVEGKMMINLRNGDVWGFPTMYAGASYPVDPLNNKPAIAKPIYLGQFDISTIK
jgi:hypothetical protein